VSLNNFICPPNAVLILGEEGFYAVYKKNSLNGFKKQILIHVLAQQLRGVRGGVGMRGESGAAMQLSALFSVGLLV